MANALFGCFKQAILGDAALVGFPSLSLESADVRMILIDSADYTPNLSTNQDLADVPAVSRVSVTALTGEALTLSNGLVTFSADNGTFHTVSGDQSEVILLYNHTGVESTSLLICQFDTFGSGMPITPNGGDVDVEWNEAGIFVW